MCACLLVLSFISGFLHFYTFQQISLPREWCCSQLAWSSYTMLITINKITHWPTQYTELFIETLFPDCLGCAKVDEVDIRLE